jgi:hypothetical protein
MRSRRSLAVKFSTEGANDQTRPRGPRSPSAGRGYTGEQPTGAVWTAAQLAAFLNYVCEDSLYAWWWLIALRGLRRGEGRRTAVGRIGGSASPGSPGSRSRGRRPAPSDQPDRGGTAARATAPTAASPWPRRGPVSAPRPCAAARPGSERPMPPCALISRNALILRCRAAAQVTISRSTDNSRPCSTAFPKPSRWNSGPEDVSKLVASGFHQPIDPSERTPTNARRGL